MINSQTSKPLLVVLVGCILFIWPLRQLGAQILPDCELLVDYQCSVDETWLVLTQWADAWSDRDIDNYLGFYSGASSPDPNKTRSQWERDRRRALAAAKAIKIRLHLIDVQLLADQTARVTLIQYYDSEHYRDIVLKTLSLTAATGSIKIIREAVDRQLNDVEAQAILDAFR